MNITAVRFTGPVEGPDGKPIERLASAVLKDGLVHHGDRRYPLHMVESWSRRTCPSCGDDVPDGAKGRTCGSKRCAAKLRSKGQPQPKGRGSR